MSRRDIAMLAGLSLIWGASFMFIRVADRELDPSALVWFRVLFGCAVLVPVVLYALRREGLRQARAAWLVILLVGIVNTAAPFMLFSWAETRITSSLAGILQAAVPIFTVILAVRFAGERVSGLRWVGVLIGFAGVALLVGSPGQGGTLASLAVVAAAFCYAVGATLSSRLLKGTEPLVIAAGSTVAATIVMTPVAAFHMPTTVPGWKEIASVIVLGVLGTGVAYILFFALIRSAGASRASLVTYLIPGIALFYGVALLGEPLRAADVAGLALILSGVLLAGRANARRRAPAQVAMPAAGSSD
jgi:drug/metabolite transporter (DMT)-like permease